jgi:hypothetical protein
LGGAIEKIVGMDRPTIHVVTPATWIKSAHYRLLPFASSMEAFTPYEFRRRARQEIDGHQPISRSNPTAAAAADVPAAGC